MVCDRTSVWDGARRAARGEGKGTCQRGKMRRQGGGRLHAVAAVLLTLASTMPPGYHSNLGRAQPVRIKRRLSCRAAPTPEPTSPYPLQTSSHDFSKPFGSWLRNPIYVYRPTEIPKSSFENSVRLNDLVKDGKIYLSLADALALAIENNYDIAIARYDLDIADTDILQDQDWRDSPGSAIGPGNGHTGRFDIESLHGRRTGRNDGGLGRSGFRSFGVNADNSRRGADTGGLRSLGDRDDAV